MTKRFISRADRSKSLILGTAILILGCSFTLNGAAQNIAPSLPFKYRAWLEEEVPYIISKKERAVFLQLDNDNIRSLFIQAFWKQRDPTPGTPENEYKAEHYRRLSVANKKYGFGSTTPGWKTDRGFIYIILGEPRTIEEHSSQQELKDTEIWFYQDMAKYSLQNAFYIVYIRKNNSDLYTLYSPAKDGPNAFFIRDTMMDPADFYSAYGKLRDLNPAIAEVSLSLVPGEGNAASGRASLASELLIQKISTVPILRLNDFYADKLMKFRGLVDVEYSINYINSDFLVQIRQDDSGVFFVHYLIEPERLSVGSYESKYYSNLVLNGMVSDKNDKTIFQFEKEYQIELKEEQARSAAQPPLQINDMFPLIPGEYRFSILMKNTISKEFTAFEEKVIIPEVDDAPRLSDILLCYDAKTMADGSGVYRPFQFEGMLLFTQPKNVLFSSDQFSAAFQVWGVNGELRENAMVTIEIIKGGEIVYKNARNIAGSTTTINILEKIPLENMPAAFYEMRVALKDQSGNELDARRINYAVSTLAGYARPLVKTTALPVSNDALNNYRLGMQHSNKSNYVDAAREFETARFKKREDVNFAISLAGAYLHLNRFGEILDVLIPFLEKEPAIYEVFFFLGKAAQGKEDYGGALKYYIQAASHFGADIPLLNSMGDCYFRLENFAEASKFWKKSMEMNPKQPLVQKKIDTLQALMKR